MSPADDLIQREADLAEDPIRQFGAWFAEARAAGVSQAEAMAVASATRDGVPSARMVLMKQFDEAGFVFFTNYDSRKGAELLENPRAALLFHWEPLGRQVRIEGSVAPVERAETERYVRSRPRGSQLSALASPQSQVIESREWLEQQVAGLAERYATVEAVALPVPERWGGFRVAPLYFEFWQHRTDRLHDRFVYTPAPGGGWALARLAP